MQLQSHLLGNVHEQVVEYFKQHRVSSGACCKFDSTMRPPVQHDMVKSCEIRLPAGLNDSGGVFFRNDCRTGDDIARSQVFAHHQRGIEPLAVGVHANGFTTGHVACFMRGMLRLGRRVARDDGFD